MRKTVYVILVLCCFIIKTYSINRPYYHFKQLSIKEGLPTSIISLYNPQNEMFRLLGTKRSFSQNETFFFSHPYPALFRLISHF